MKPPRLTIAACFASLLLCVAIASPSSIAHAQQAPDNSGQNKIQTSTADDQSNAKSDRMITAHIRKALMADKDLSTYGHNVKIITVQGAVTLKGPVESEDEKQKIVSDASGVVSADKITNLLSVKQ
jgi:osmotically-inducible protein OsmY